MEPLYTLRYVLPPDLPDTLDRRMEDLLTICHTGRIDDVMFFILPEDYSTGQWRKSEYEPWLAAAVHARERLAAEGIASSLNPWHTLMHLDRGRDSRDLGFRPMVLDTGHECLSIACPLCERWRSLWIEAYTDFARAGFTTLWIEDDFRFHNHNHDRGWGGCFCETHIAVLRQRGMQATNRAELLQNLNAAGMVHPDRLIWMGLNRDTHVELARAIRTAMDAINPAIRLGLMTSSVPQHTQEGRDWVGLFNALGGPERALIRPHFAPYKEGCGENVAFFFQNLSQTLNSIPAGVPALAEIENYPMSGFAKSVQFTAQQMALAVVGGCDGVTLDVFDFLGNGSESDPRMAPMLGSQKVMLASLRDAIADSTLMGIGCIQPLTTSWHAPGFGGSSGVAIPTFHYGWGCALQGFGYPTVNIDNPDRVNNGGIYALSAPAVWAIPTDLLTTLLTQSCCLIEPYAADVIQERGLGHLIGLQHVTWLNRSTSDFSIEEWIGRDDGALPERASANASTLGECIAIFQLRENATPRTHILDSRLNPFGTGTYTYCHPSGGRGLVIPIPIPAPVYFFSRIRQRWMERLLCADFDCAGIPRLVDSPWIVMVVRRTENRVVILLGNTMFEYHEALTLHLPPSMMKLNWSLLAHGRKVSGKIEKRADDQICLDIPIAGGDWLALEGCT